MLSILLTAVQNILYLNSVKGIGCYISVATPTTVDSRMWLNSTKGMHYFYSCSNFWYLLYCWEWHIYLNSTRNALLHFLGNGSYM